MTTALVAQATTPFFRWDWVGRELDQIWARTLEHLHLTVLSIALGLAVAVAMAAVVRWRRSTYGFLSGFSGLLYTIPSLAAFAVLARIFGLTSIWTPVLALASYALLILLRNTVAGLDSVPAEVREAADGMGYTPTQRFFRVELPLALPVVVAGVRIATVTVVGLVTVTALLGRGGLGFFILNGFRRSIVFPTEIIVGTVLVVVLATVLDLILLGVERALTPWAGRR